MRKLITGAAAAATLGATLLLAQSNASADTAYESTGGYKFASNDSGAWRVRNAPVDTATATQTLDSTGVTLSISPDPDAQGPNPGYADSGVIVPVGTVGELFDSSGTYVPVEVKGPASENTSVNLYFDASGDGKYFSFGPGGAFHGTNGDEIWFDDQTLTSRSQIAAVDGAKAWAWVGIAGNAEMSATVTSVNGKDLVQPVTVTPRFRHSASKTCGFVSTYVGVDDIPAGAIADPDHYGFKVTITNRRTGDKVTPDRGSLRPGQSSSFARSFREDSGPRDVRIFKNGDQVRIVHVATNCR